MLNQWTALKCSVISLIETEVKITQSFAVLFSFMYVCLQETLTQNVFCYFDEARFNLNLNWPENESYLFIWFLHLINSSVTLFLTFNGYLVASSDTICDIC